VLIASNASSKETVLALKETGERVKSIEDVAPDEEDETNERLSPYPKQLRFDGPALYSW
jgi:hypothetical protein